MTLDENWKEATKLSQIQEAVYAYMFVMAELHPRHYGARNLLKLMHNLDWLSFRHDRVYALKTVIDGVLARYNYLAIQKRPPLTFKELEDFVEKALKGIGGTSRMPDKAPDYGNSSSSADWNNSSDWEENGGGSRGRGGVRGAPSTSTSSSARNTGSRDGASKFPLCYSYNKPTGCLRKSTGRTCTLSTGALVYHVCSHTNSKGEMCLGSHSIMDHK